MRYRITRLPLTIILSLLLMLPAITQAGNNDAAPVKNRPALSVALTPSGFLNVSASPTSGFSSVSCFGSSDGTAAVQATNGVFPYTYQWSNGSSSDNQFGLSAGVYTVTVTDLTGCSAVFTDTVGSPDSIIIQFSANTPPTCGGCNDGSVVANAFDGTPNYSFLWNNGFGSGPGTSSFNNNLSAGIYTVTVTDQNGCTKSNSVLLGSLPLSTTVNITNITCNGFGDGMAMAAPVGGTAPYTYNWSNGATMPSISGLVSGVYSVTVTDNVGSTSSAIGIVAQAPPMGLTAVVISQPFPIGSANGIAQATGTGGLPPYSFVWSTGFSATSNAISTLTGLVAGTYTVTMTDNNGCSNVSSVILQTPGSGLSVNVNATDVTCPGGNDGSATPVVTGGTTPFTYLWSNGSSQLTINNLSAGIYTVTVSDQTGATTVGNATVTSPTPIFITSTSMPPTCGNSNGSITASASGGAGGFSYLWATGATGTTISGLAAGNYTVTVTDANGCTQVGVEPLSSTGTCTTEFFPVHCGATLTTLGDYLYYQGVPGATNYRYQITATGFSTVFVRGFAVSNLRMSLVPGIQLGTTYNVSIAAFVNGSWGNYGNSCAITTPSNVPATQLAPSSCNVTVSTLNQWLFCNPVQGADNYRYEVTNSSGFSQTYTRGYAATSFRIGFVPGISYNTTYNVRVAASLNGSFGSYGPTCTVTTPATTPTTQLNTASCGVTLTSWSTYLGYSSLPGATNYRYEVTTTGFSTVRVRNAPSPVFRFDWIQGVQPNTTYNVRVAAFVGGAWGNYGNSCTVTTPNLPILRLGFFDQEELPESVDALAPGLSVNVFPNPNDGAFSITGQAQKQLFLQVFDLSGRVVVEQTQLPTDGNYTWELQLPAHLRSGIYFVKVASGDHSEVKKVVVRK
ncbi:MAG: T9SS type A sorting domain-containing protein [Salibacteraceae bacterium]